MNHLLIDITFLINELKRKRPPHGIPRVVLAYLRHYQESIQLVYRVRSRIYILPKRCSQQIIELILHWKHSLYKKILWLVIKAICKSQPPKPKEHYFLFKIDQNGMKYPTYFSQLQRQDIKTIVMLHDLFPIIYPEYSDPTYAVQFEQHIQLSLKQAAGIICVSEYTARTTKHYVEGNNLNCPPLCAAHLAPGFSPTISQEPRPVDGPYFVIISTIVARKNHLFLLHIWRKLADELGTKTPKLVIIGKRSAECSSTLAMLDRCKQVQQHVIEFTASDSDLQTYLTHATALLFPTFAEGYGLPLIEALSINVPVLCSELPIFREIAQDIPDYLDSLDGKGWLEAIKDYAKVNSPRRTAQLQRLSTFTMPTWDTHFQQVEAFLQQL